MYQTQQQRDAARVAREEQLRVWRTEHKPIEDQIPDRVQERNFVDPSFLFLSVVRREDLEGATELFNQGVDINISNKDGLTALHQAAMNNDIPMIEFLLENGADLEIKDMEGWTPLHTAAQWENEEAVQCLVEHNANLLSLSDDLQTPLDVTESKEVQAYLTERMEEKGITPESVEDAKSAEEKKLEADVKDWISNGNAIADFPSFDGVTPLHIAVAKGYSSVALYLLEHGANPNTRDWEGWTPLHAAVFWEQTNLLSPLIEKGGDVEEVTFHGESCAELTEKEETKALLQELKTRFETKPVQLLDNLPAVARARTKSISRRNSIQRRETPKKDLLEAPAAVPTPERAPMLKLSETGKEINMDFVPRAPDEDDED